MIKVRGLAKSFGGKRVLEGLDLDVEKEKFCVIIGRSGCGKTVLLKHLLGILLPDSGTIWIDGRDMRSLSSKERYRLRLRFGLLFQSAALFDSLAVGENVAFALVEHTKMTPRERALRVSECLELVGLRGLESRMPAELSGGMRKRVGLARAIALKPEVLLFDEPTAGLDPITADAINQLMIQLNESLKITSVAVTHDMGSAYRIADRVCMLEEGRIRKSGSPEEIRNSQDPVVRRFVEGLSEGFVNV